MRTIILALAAFGVLLGMWLNLGVRILRETTTIVEAAAAECMKCPSLEDAKALIAI